MAKKIKVIIPYLMKESLLNDEEHFDIPLGTIGNRLFSYYSNLNFEKVELRSEKGESFQFNLNKFNEEIYFETLREHNFSSDADYLRNILFHYLNNIRSERERIVFYEICNILEESIKREKKLIIIYGEGKESRLVSPYFIKEADRENSSYLFCWCEKNQDYRAYKISKIKSAYIALNNLEKKDLNYIKIIEKNFDPFLSYGKEVKVKLTEKGDELFGRVLQNKPKVLNRTELSDKREIEYVLQCDEKVAKIYFAQFFSEVEILEPLELKEWFREEYLNILMKYRVKCSS